MFAFRPWVRRAGLSIVLVAAAATATIGWIGERALWAYIALLWIGGLKVALRGPEPQSDQGPPRVPDDARRAPARDGLRGEDGGALALPHEAGGRASRP